MNQFPTLATGKKGIADVDISKWISKVTFELHSSFPEPKRGNGFVLVSVRR